MKFIYCGNRTSIGLQNGTLGVCELRLGHIGPHQEQRSDNGKPRTWGDRNAPHTWHDPNIWSEKAPPVTDDDGEQEHESTTR